MSTKPTPVDSENDLLTKMTYLIYLVVKYRLIFKYVPDDDHGTGYTIKIENAHFFNVDKATQYILNDLGIAEHEQMEEQKNIEEHYKKTIAVSNVYQPIGEAHNVKAVQWTGNLESEQEISKLGINCESLPASDQLKVHTSYGVVLVNLWWYVIIFADNSLKFQHPDKFESLYKKKE